MSGLHLMELGLIENLENFELPLSVQDRLQHLLDRQENGEPLDAAEQQEAERLVAMAEWLSLLKLRA